jgi:hypothetical protein
MSDFFFNFKKNSLVFEKFLIYFILKHNIFLIRCLMRLKRLGGHQFVISDCNRFVEPCINAFVLFRD